MTYYEKDQVRIIEVDGEFIPQYKNSFGSWDQFYYSDKWYSSGIEYAFDTKEDALDFLSEITVSKVHEY